MAATACTKPVLAILEILLAMLESGVVYALNQHLGARIEKPAGV